MKEFKIQSDLLKAMCNGTRWGYDDTTIPGRVGITADGYVLYLLNADRVFLRLDNEQKRSTTLARPARVESKDLWPLVPTNDLLQRKKYTAQKYLFRGHENSPVWLNPKLLKHFESPALWQTQYCWHGPIIVTEDRDGYPDIVGFVMPVNINAKEET